MSKLDAYLDASDGARLVRWPFRILAAVPVIAMLFAILASGYQAIFHHDLIR